MSAEGGALPGRLEGRRLEGRRLVVVGATSGIGRALALRAVALGARVVAAGRRSDRLAELSEAGVATVVSVDVTAPADCRGLADSVASVLGSAEAVLSCAGGSALNPLAALTPADWGEVLGTNLIGSNNVVAALLPVLAPGALVGTISSDSAGCPPYALGAYAASKAALETMWAGWRVEAPEFRFCTFALGPTFPTDFGRDFDPAALEDATPRWTRAGFAWDRMVDTEQVAGLLTDTVASLLQHPGLSVEHMLIRSPAARTGAASA
ncbi:MAG TPA: SDR family oxidoreductase [Acidimicrobiales bacterium]|nr:SDR family oxidoreductase [Acidimicrobiales bacterium]